MSSIREFGFKVPVLARSNGDVIDGHLRLKAAEKLGIAEVPVILCDDWTDGQVKAFRLLVNRSVNWADWDAELLSLELLDLKGLDFDLNLTGFDVREIDALLLGDEPDAQEDSLVSVAESLETGSASGRLVINIMTCVSQWEREATGERTRDALPTKNPTASAWATSPTDTGASPIESGWSQTLKSKRCSRRSGTCARGAAPYVGLRRS